MRVIPKDGEKKLVSRIEHIKATGTAHPQQHGSHHSVTRLKFAHIPLSSILGPDRLCPASRLHVAPGSGVADGAVADPLPRPDAAYAWWFRRAVRGLHGPHLFRATSAVVRNACGTGRYVTCGAMVYRASGVHLPVPALDIIDRSHWPSRLIVSTCAVSDSRDAGKSRPEGAGSDPPHTASVHRPPHVRARPSRE